MKWLLVITIYFAPPNAVDWDGPWAYGESHLMEEQYSSEAECRNTAIQFIARLHEGMLAPIRFRCVPVEAGLPQGAPR